MATLIIYDADGKAFEREAVDARECLASGFYHVEKPEARLEPCDSVNADDRAGETDTPDRKDVQAGHETGAPVSGGEVGETVKAKVGKK